MEPGRHLIEFPSGSSTCAAWHYPGIRGACVVMAGGFAVTKEPATDRFAAAFSAAGFDVLAFDYRGFGGSGGAPLVARLDDHREDWRAAIAASKTVAGVDPTKVALWGFSISGGLVLEAAADDASVAAVIAQNPLVDGRAATRSALAHQRVPAAAATFALAVIDAAGGTIGRPPRTLPLAGPPGTPAVLTTPDAADADRALDPSGKHTTWQRRVAARSTLALGSFRPGRRMDDIAAPVLMVLAAEDHSAPPGPARTAAAAGHRVELLEVGGGHYAAFLEAHETVAAREITFLQEHLA